MDFRELVYITVVADCKSVTAAAKKMYISQPSLSQIISKVENDLGIKLFDRTAYPITLTYAGEKYVDTARKILMMKDNLRRELTDIGNGVRGKITVGIPVERAGYMLPETLKEFRQVYPGVEIRTQEAKASVLLESLQKGETNLVVIPKNEDGLGPELQEELIYREELLFVAGPGVVTPDMLTEDGAYIRMEKVTDLPFIILKKGHSIRRAVDRLFRACGATPNVIMETTSTINAVQLANSGCGVTIVPARAVEIFGGREKFNCYRLGEGYAWDVNVIYLKESYLDGAERYFIEVMKKLFSHRQ